MSDKKDLIKAMQEVIEAEEAAKIDPLHKLVDEIVDDLIKAPEPLVKNDPKTHLPGTMLDKVAPAPAPAPSPKPPMPKMNVPKLKSPKPPKMPNKQPDMHMMEKSDNMSKLCNYLKKCGEMRSMQKSEKLQKPVPEGVSAEKFDSCVDQVKAKSGKKVNAYAVCNSSLSKDNAPNSSDPVRSILQHFIQSKNLNRKRSPENQAIGLDKKEIMPVEESAKEMSAKAQEQMEKPASDRKEDK